MKNKKLTLALCSIIASVCQPEAVSGANQPAPASKIQFYLSQNQTDFETLPDQVRDVCGTLDIQLCGSGVTVARLAVSDLNGDPLWGECAASLKSRRKAKISNMDVTGGDNTLFLNLKKPVTLNDESATSFKIAIPAITLKKGYTVKAFDADGMLIGAVSAQTPATEAERKAGTVVCRATLTKDFTESQDASNRGFYKEMFIDAGKRLSDIYDIPVIHEFGWRHDYLLTNDSTFQRSVLVGTETDDNGILLYPDGEPRYRMVYMNGGRSNKHGISLGVEGRNNYITFVNNGGSYVGTCAGAYLACMGKDGAVLDEYLHLIPTMLYYTGVFTWTDMVIPKDSPLLKYYDFGGDFKIDSVTHKGGCFAVDSLLLPVNAEILMYYDRPLYKKMHGNVSTWAYKVDENKGRVVCSGSHPEQFPAGDRLQMMEGMCRYAVDGNGKVTDKGTLINGQSRVMDQLSTAGKPENARIGDRQYHHFKLEVPAGGIKNLEIMLTSESGKYLTLALRKGDFAWRSDADFLLAQGGCNKTLSIDSLAEGIWYVSVCCPDAPESVCAKDSITYNGDTSLLNGVPYSIKATWE